jgi:hypothetical protein
MLKEADKVFAHRQLALSCSRQRIVVPQCAKETGTFAMGQRFHPAH